MARFHLYILRKMSRQCLSSQGRNIPSWVTFCKIHQKRALIYLLLYAIQS
ncbi:hypothetical protein JHK86_035276 [Glycine max]|nr:hypothetical protein JHK86_035276 [Glycine max]